jgi:hypothetical protein
MAILGAEGPGKGPWNLRDFLEEKSVQLLWHIAGNAPEVVLIGPEVGEVTPFREGLSPPLEAALDQAAALVVRECTS